MQVRDGVVICGRADRTGRCQIVRSPCANRARGLESERGEDPAKAWQTYRTSGECQELIQATAERLRTRMRSDLDGQHPNKED
jgi:hypothetical protein